METEADSVADSDNINTSTPWKLRFIKSPVVSSAICKQDDDGFDLFVSGLKDKVLSAENLKEVPEEKVKSDATREEQGLRCDGTDDDKSVLYLNSDKASTPTNVSSIDRPQNKDTLPSVKLWKPVDTSYESFIVLDETIMSVDSSEEDSFQKSDGNFARNVSGILPLNGTSKIVHSSAYDPMKLGNVTILISDVSDDGKNESKSMSISSEKTLLQNVTTVTTVQNDNENKTKESEKHINVQNNPPHCAGVGKTDCVSGNMVINKLEPNAILGNLTGNIGKAEQATCTEKEGDKLGQAKYSFEKIEKTEQFNNSGKTEQQKCDDGETGSFEQVESDNWETGKLEQVKCNNGATGKLEQVETGYSKIGMVEQVKSEICESEKLESVDGETEQVKSDKRGTGMNEEVKSENLFTDSIDKVKFETGETEKLKFVDGKTKQVKFNKRETGKNEQVKSEKMEIGNIEQVKAEREETETLRSVVGMTEQMKSDNREIVRCDQVKSENLETENAEQVISKREETETLKSVDEMTEQIKSNDREPGEIEEEKSDNLEFGKTEQVKPDSGDFVSSDPEENADNNNPEWELLKKLETDEERYKAVRLRWRNLVIPNPNKNLTYRSRGYWTTNEKQKQVSEVKQGPVITSRKRTHSADPIEYHNPAKRQRTFSCTEVFDRKMIDIHKNLSRERNAILQQHERAVQNLVNKTNKQLRSYPPGSVNDEHIRALHVQNVVELRYKCDNRLAAVESESMSKLRTLEKAMEEVRVFNTFYQGLEEGCDDALLLSDEQLMEVLEEDHLYECFAEFYNG